MTNQSNYKATIVESSRELTVKERIQKKELSSAYRIDKVMSSSEYDECRVDDLAFWARIAVHNESLEESDYENYLFETKEGEQYVTGSASAWRSFCDIRDELEGSGESAIGQSYLFTRCPSKNQKQGFILCNLL